jgi:hypothetical protein
VSGSPSPADSGDGSETTQDGGDTASPEPMHDTSSGPEPGSSSTTDALPGSSSSGAVAGCTMWVGEDGDDAPGCGTEDAPCRTLTQVFALAESGCTVQVGPGTYGTASGEMFPLQPPADVELIGAGADPNGTFTLVDDSGDTSGTSFPIICDEESDPLRTTLALVGGRVHDLIVRGGYEPDYATVLVLEGDTQLDRIRVEGGQEGIFTAGNSVVEITDVVATGAGHAAIKPAGDSVVEVVGAELFGSKDALEPICRAVTTVRETEAYCNGNGLEALDRATTTMLDNDVHHNINGIAARGTATRVVAKGNRLHDNAFGVVEIFGAIDLGTGVAPGGNEITNNLFAGLMLNHVPHDTEAIGNTWQPHVDDVDAVGLYTGTPALSGPICGLNSTEIEAPIPNPCTPDAPLIPDAGYQNFVLNDGSCSLPPSCGDDLGPCPALGQLLLSSD